MPKKKEKVNKKSTNERKEQEEPVKDPSTECDSEEDLWSNPDLPSQEHCTWLLNVIKLHAKKIAVECIKAYEEKVNLQIGQIKENIQSIKRDTEKLQGEIDSITTNKSRIKRLQHENNQISSKVRETKKIADSIEQLQYENNLQIVGFPEPKENGDDVKQFVKMSKEKLGKKVKASDIK